MVLFPSIFGPAGFFSSFFLNPGSLLIALSFLIPLLLLYLIKPKPQNVAVPSLMFILKDMGKSNVHRFFRTLLKDILFIIQFLAILLLALSIARPFVNVSQDSLLSHTVLVLDTSASLSAQDRFDQMQDVAIEQLSKENIIILSGGQPKTLELDGEEQLGAREAKDLIQGLDESHLQGDLPGALDLAAQHVGPQTKVAIVSDLVLGSFEDPKLVKAKIKVLQSKGATVELIIIPAQGENIGIVDARLSGDEAALELKIQNFNEQPEEFGIEHNGKPLDLPSNLLAKRGQSGSLLSVSVPLGNGKNEFTLTPKDDLMIDNYYYVSAPEQPVLSTLIISNDQNLQGSKLMPALTAAGDQFTTLEISHGSPPKVPDLRHDIYIIKDVSTQFVLPGVISDLKEEVESGKVLVVFAQQGLFGLDSADFSEMMPVRAKPQAEQQSGRHEIVSNSSLGLMRGLSDLGQADGSQLLRVRATDSAITYASVSTNDGMEPVIAAKRLGRGVVIYYGIMDRVQTDIDPQSYAILWGRIVDFSLQNPSDLNIPTGAILTSPDGRVNGPWGRQRTPIEASLSGFYTAGPMTLAANLYPLQLFAATEETVGRIESAIAEPVELEVEGISDDLEGEEEKVPRELSTLFIILGLGIIIFELFFIKYRGDL